MYQKFTKIYFQLFRVFMLLMIDPSFLTNSSNYGTLISMLTFHNFLHIAVFCMFLSTGQYLENFDSMMISDLLNVNADESVRLN